MLGPGGIEVIVGAGRGVLGQREEWWRGSGNGDWRLHRRLYFGALTALLRRADGEAGFCGGCGQALRLRIANRRGS